jgi:endonuclease YncB( thermonuclease family)
MYGKLTCTVAMTLLVLAAGFGLAATEVLTAKCIAVSEGDVLVVEDNERRQVIRLAGIDSPELNQPFGTEAQEYTAGRVLGKTLEVEVSGYDDHGRVLGKVRVDDRDLAQDLIEAGLAWHYSAHLDDEANAILAYLESGAKWKGSGLWSQPEPIPPWEFRKGHPPGPGGELPAQPPSAGGKSLSDIAGNIELKKNEDGQAVISGLPPVSPTPPPTRQQPDHGTDDSTGESWGSDAEYGRSRHGRDTEGPTPSAYAWVSSYWLDDHDLVIVFGVNVYCPRRDCSGSLRYSAEFEDRIGRNTESGTVSWQAGGSSYISVEKRHSYGIDARPVRVWVTGTSVR